MHRHYGQPGFPHRGDGGLPAACAKRMASFVDSLVAPLSLINAFIVTAAIRKKAGRSKNVPAAGNDLGRVRRI